ncbi:MAG TPA: glycoside hydrolase domain-containing protein [Planctomycetota bacterium]|nr:glycoside hydrolase domain-containing protein [Planctomycetota bacterium]
MHALFVHLFSVVIGAGAPGPGQVILDECSYWRAFFTWKTPLVRKDAELRDGPNDSYGPSFVVQTEPPPDGWREPAFDDSTWLRWRLDRGRRRETDYGFKVFGGYSPPLALLVLRGKFRVDDPAGVRGLKLSLGYRGGVVAYLNGREVARGHLPKGDIAPQTLAEDYPPEVFLRPDGQCIRAEFSDPKKCRDRVEKRIRAIEPVEIPVPALRKGVNVLAVELHRAPYFGNGLEKENMNHESVWSTCGLAGLELRAEAGVEPNATRPTGLQVWNSSVMSRLTPAEYGDPNEPLGPIVIPGARNGTFTGKLVVTSDGPIRGLKAVASDLAAGEGKAKLPAACAQVLYTTRCDYILNRYRAPLGFWDALSDAPPGDAQPEKGKGAGPAALVPIWLKVKVPADAAPGDYTGKLTLSIEGEKPVEAPVLLRVADWTLCDPRDLSAHMALIQSTDTLAIHYKVSPWSEEHWRLIDKSLALLGELGNKYVFLPMICRTNFGNEQSIVRWVKEGEGYKPDFTLFDRYLDLVQKHMRPDVVCLYVWDRYTGEFHWAGVGEKKGRAPLVTRLDPATGKAEDLETPELGTPAARAFWEPAYRELRARLEKRGLLGAAMMGMNGDAYRPTDAMGRMFQELMPGTMWVSNSHSDARGSKMAGIPVGYNTAVYVNLFPPPSALPWDATRKVGWRLAHKADLFTRSSGPATKQPLYHTQQLGVYRLTVEAALLANYSGLGRAGFDFWPVLGKDSIRGGVKHSATVAARYPPCWDQLNIDRATENLVAPGPDGPIPTERFENVREGMLEAEARIFLERALLDPAQRAKLGDELARKLQKALDERAWRIRAACIGAVGYELADSEPFRHELFTCAAEAANKLGAK